MTTAKQATITRMVLDDEDRDRELADHYGKAVFAYEITLRGWAEKFCPSYVGGMWRFFRLSNGGFYMSLSSKEPKLRVIDIEIDFDRFLSPFAFSIALNLYVFRYFSKVDYPQEIRDRFVADFEKLYEYATFQDEKADILRFLN